MRPTELRVQARTRERGIHRLRAIRQAGRTPGTGLVKYPIHPHPQIRRGMSNRKREHVRNSRSSEFAPDWASPPGDTLAALLEERSMTQTELAGRLGVTLKHVNRVVKGVASISADL